MKKVKESALPKFIIRIAEELMFIQGMGGGGGFKKPNKILSNNKNDSK